MTLASAAIATLVPVVSFAQTFSVPNFVRENVLEAGGVTSIQFGPADRIYVSEKRGRVLVAQRNPNGTYGTPTVVVDMRGSVEFRAESGLLGMALDPDFATNRHMFLFHTTATDQRLVRYTLDAPYNTATGAPTVILSGLPRTAVVHKAGDIQFHPLERDNIYIALGDDTQPELSQTPTVYNGKMLRVNKTTGQGVPGNPMAESDLGTVRSRIWAIGHRNPFRFTFHPLAPTPDVMYVSENGNTTDRVSFVRKGANGNWGQGGDPPFLAPPDPNHRVLARVTPSSLVGIAIARGGAFADPAAPGSDVLLVANWGQAILRYRLTGANLDTAMPIAADSGRPFAAGLAGGGVHMIFGPDGALYTSVCGPDESPGGVVFRIRFMGGNPPSASFTTTPDPPRGQAPLAVTFTDTSTDDGTITGRAWNFGDGGTDSARNPAHTFANPGTYTVRLTVTDNHGLTASTTRVVTVIRSISLTLNGTIRDGRSTAVSPLPGNTTMHVYQADGTTRLPFAGGAGPGGNAFTVAGGIMSRTFAVEAAGSGLVISAGEGDARVKPAYAGISLPATGSVTRTVNFHLSDTALYGRLRTPRGAPAVTDLGVARASGPYAIAGGRDLMAPASPSGVAHRIVGDELGFFYVPLRAADGGNFTFDVAADTRTAEFIPSSFVQNIAGNAAVRRDITVGLKNGGMSCDNLGALPMAPVEYPSQIHTLWTARCNGCHNGGSSANGGLDLTGDSWAQLVNAASKQVPGKKLVVPGDLAASYLHEKINCGVPQSDERMSPMDPMPLAEQRLVAAWITQGARRDSRQPVVDAGAGGMGGTGGPGGTVAGRVAFGRAAEQRSRYRAPGRWWRVDIGRERRRRMWCVRAGGPRPAAQPRGCRAACADATVLPSAVTEGCPPRINPLPRRLPLPLPSRRPPPRRHRCGWRWSRTPPRWPWAARPASRFTTSGCFAAGASTPGWSSTIARRKSCAA